MRSIALLPENTRTGGGEDSLDRNMGNGCCFWGRDGGAKGDCCLLFSGEKDEKIGREKGEIFIDVLCIYSVERAGRQYHRLSEQIHDAKSHNTIIIPDHWSSKMKKMGHREFHSISLMIEKGSDNTIMLKRSISTAVCPWRRDWSQLSRERNADGWYKG